MNFSDCHLLSRCVKCNGNELKLIEADEVKQQLNWNPANEFTKVQEYLQCTKCKQIYWEGSTWKKAKLRFETLSSE